METTADESVMEEDADVDAPPPPLDEDAPAISAADANVAPPRPPVANSPATSAAALDDAEEERILKAMDAEIERQRLLDEACDEAEAEAEAEYQRQRMLEEQDEIEVLDEEDTSDDEEGVGAEDEESSEEEEEEESDEELDEGSLQAMSEKELKAMLKSRGEKPRWVPPQLCEHDRRAGSGATRCLIAASSLVSAQPPFDLVLPPLHPQQPRPLFQG